MSLKLSRFYFAGIALIALLLGCTPSSHALRYSHTKKAPKAKKTLHVSKKLSKVVHKTKAKIKEAVRFADTGNDDEDYVPDEKDTISLSSILAKYSVTKNDLQSYVINNELRDKILLEIVRWKDTRYIFGGTTYDGIDCSAFTRSIYSNSFALNLPRTAREQYEMGDMVYGKNQLKFGDLVFFNTRRGVKPGHVGIYIGDNCFAHSSSHGGVMISSLDSEYYAKRFMGARRVENFSAK